LANSSASLSGLSGDSGHRAFSGMMNLWVRMCVCVRSSLGCPGPRCAHLPQRLLQLDVVRERGGGTRDLVLIEITTRGAGDARIEREVHGGAGAALGIE